VETGRGVWQACGTGDLAAFGAPLDTALIGQLRAVVQGAPTTESELRRLSGEADGWRRALQAQIDGSERRLRLLADEPAPRLGEVTAELRRLDRLRPQQHEVDRLLADPGQRARELRASWIATEGSRS
jgi:hypothetical protein